ncbi:MAG: hypothetical protein ACFE8L_12720 [Candidatus Hodarchaeota archaeon]
MTVLERLKEKGVKNASQIGKIFLEKGYSYYEINQYDITGEFTIEEQVLLDKPVEEIRKLRKLPYNIVLPPDQMLDFLDDRVQEGYHCYIIAEIHGRRSKFEL